MVIELLQLSQFVQRSLHGLNAGSSTGDVNSNNVDAPGHQAAGKGIEQYEYSDRICNTTMGIKEVKRKGNASPVRYL